MQTSPTGCQCRYYEETILKAGGQERIPRGAASWTSWYNRARNRWRVAWRRTNRANRLSQRLGKAQNAQLLHALLILPEPVVPQLLILDLPAIRATLPPSLHPHRAPPPPSSLPSRCEDTLPTLAGSHTQAQNLIQRVSHYTMLASSKSSHQPSQTSSKLHTKQHDLPQTATTRWGRHQHSQKKWREQENSKAAGLRAK